MSYIQLSYKIYFRECQFKTHIVTEVAIAHPCSTTSGIVKSLRLWIISFCTIYVAYIIEPLFSRRANETEGCMSILPKTKHPELRCRALQSQSSFNYSLRIFFKLFFEREFLYVNCITIFLQPCLFFPSVKTSPQSPRIVISLLSTCSSYCD